MARWAKTEGQVLQTGIQNAITSDGRIRFMPDIQYRYEVNGQQYSGNQWSTVSAASSQGWAKRKAQKYQIGDTVTVHYRVNNPSQAVLVRGLFNTIGYFWLVFIVGMLLITIGLPIALSDPQILNFVLGLLGN